MNDVRRMFVGGDPMIGCYNKEILSAYLGRDFPLVEVTMLEFGGSVNTSQVAHQDGGGKDLPFRSIVPGAELQRISASGIRFVLMGGPPEEMGLKILAIAPEGKNGLCCSSDNCKNTQEVRSRKDRRHGQRKTGRGLSL
jgi:hypothetical protein|tara:strand:- start:974 stop:1390 length:417 start_codon:yes stop_codon:yes gene_type:complete